MAKLKDQIVGLIKQRAEQEAAYLAGEFARATSQDREQISAELEFERWLAEACCESL